VTCITRVLILINLNWEDCIRCTQEQLGTWEASRYLLEDRSANDPFSIGEIARLNYANQRVNVV
jgi:hypothetical protein